MSIWHIPFLLYALGVKQEPSGPIMVIRNGETSSVSLDFPVLAPVLTPCCAKHIESVTKSQISNLKAGSRLYDT